MDAGPGVLALAAFVAGLAGGVHCAAMCGPIVALCGERPDSPGRWRRALAYNTGRLLSYTIAGALAGALGSTALALRGGAGAPLFMAAVAGVTLLLLAAHLAGCAALARALERAGGAIWRCVQPYSRHVLPADSFPRALALGALWGWLPCGMVYAVLATAVAAAHPAQGAIVMLAFGLGTLPNVLGIAFAAERLKRALRLAIVRRCAAAVVAGFGVLELASAFHGLH